MTPHRYAAGQARSVKGGWRRPKFSECYLAAGDRQKFTGRLPTGKEYKYF